MMIVTFAIVGLLLPGAPLAPNPVRRISGTPNRVVYSPDRRYCVEIHEWLGNGGCLATPTVLRFPADSEEATRLKQERTTFDTEHRTIVLFQKNDRGAYERLWELRMPVPNQLAVSAHGDVLVPPFPVASQGPHATYVYRPYQIVYLVDAKGHVSDIRLSALLTNADIEKLFNPLWSVRIEETNQHRIVVLRNRNRGRFGNLKDIPTVEYDVDRHKLEGAK